MAARNIACIHHTRYMTVPLKAGIHVLPGEIVLRSTTTGFCRNTDPGDNSCQGIGVATEEQDNTAGADGALSVKVEQGTFVVDNSATNTCVAKDEGGPCYFEDANTVGNVSTNRSQAGTVINLGYSGLTGVGVKIES